MSKIFQIVVFASGNGSNFKKIHQEILASNINGNIGILISNNKQCGAVDYATEHGIKCVILDKKNEISENTFMQILEGYLPDLIILAGYLKLIPASVIRKYKHKIINIHPALLPSFGGKGMYGSNVHKAVLASKQITSGATVHFVDEKYDHGQIIDQQEVQVFPDDTAELLARRVLEVEHLLYPRVVKACCEDRIIWEGDAPRIIPSK
ncbi:MAG: phosphoribosylglycinamide formyltransferase [Candidatus Marinimicrobia bacterium]|nr:phosphoribosylglycinamide formyltransferase [Candidatus Neomarinimicrobiota bacterium]